MPAAPANPNGDGFSFKSLATQGVLFGKPAAQAPPATTAPTFGFGTGAQAAPAAPTTELFGQLTTAGLGFGTKPLPSPGLFGKRVTPPSFETAGVSFKPYADNAASATTRYLACLGPERHQFHQATNSDNTASTYTAALPSTGMSLFDKQATRMNRTKNLTFGVPTHTIKGVSTCTLSGVSGYVFQLHTEMDKDALAWY